MNGAYQIPYWRQNQGAASFPSKDETVEKEAKGTFDFRIGWYEHGLIISYEVGGKQRPVFYDQSRLNLCDGLHFCLDTRDVRDVHRGTKFCHRFMFLPGGTSTEAVPAAFWFPIHRAKGHPNPVEVSHFRFSREDIPEGGYRFSILIPDSTLTGYEPAEYSRLGFHFSVLDSEFGSFDLQHSPAFPVEEDPALWSTLELTTP